MNMDILAILMVAFGLFAVLMFVLFCIYVKKYNNEKHLTEDFDDDDEDTITNVKEKQQENFVNELKEEIEEKIEEKIENNDYDYSDDYIPKKKKNTI